MNTKINLQMFGENDGFFSGESGHGYTYAQSTGTSSSASATSWSGSGLSAEMKTYYDKNLINEAESSLIHDQFAQKKPIPANGGKTIEFRKFAPLLKATTPLTEGVTPKGDSLSVSTMTATVAQYGNFIMQTDMLQMTAIDNTILQATKLLGRQAGLTLDTITRNVLNTVPSATFPAKIVNGVETKVSARSELDATAQLNVKTIQQVVAKLRKQNAPTIGGKYVAMCHPYVAYQIMRDPEFIDAHKYAKPDNLFEGEIGEIAGVRFVQSSEARVFNDSTTSNKAVYSTVFVGEGAYGTTEIANGGLQTIVKQLGAGDDPLNQRSTVGWKAVKCAEILIPNYIVRVESRVADFDSEPDNA